MQIFQQCSVEPPIPRLSRGLFLPVHADTKQYSNNLCLLVSDRYNAEPGARHGRRASLVGLFVERHPHPSWV